MKEVKEAANEVLGQNERQFEDFFTTAEPDTTFPEYGHPLNCNTSATIS